jgi:hypothetical protein
MEVSYTVAMYHILNLLAAPFHLQRCAPMSLVLDIQGNSNQNFGTFPSPNKNQNTPCPICLSGTVNGIYMAPLDFDDIDQAVALKETSECTTLSSSSGGRKHGRDDDLEIEAQSTYLLMSKNQSAGCSNILSHERQRTGRWTPEETAFVDFLVTAFDKGSIPLPHGVKLNEFLGDVLLCKSSRLTKKMKNAKLSTRSFMLRNFQVVPSRDDCILLSNLQERFLSSIPSEATRLELRFNLVKQWRTNFSNLCLQVGYPRLDTKDWVTSLEEMGSRANQVEETVRRVRRRKLSQALKMDGDSTVNPTVAVTQVQAELSVSFDVPSTKGQNRSISVDDDDRTRDIDDSLAFLNESGNNLSSMGRNERSRALSIDFFQNCRDRSFSDDFEAVLDTLVDDGAIEVLSSHEEKARSTSPSSCGPFLDSIVNYMEKHNIPFQYADLWVPSLSPQERSGVSSGGADAGQLRLYHAGHATRKFLDEKLAYKLHEFGVYSENFSIEPGHGLPGRLYISGDITWECNIQDTDPKIFERASGAKLYGLKTAVGIPLNTILVGRMVVIMYSCEDVPVDMSMARDCASELVKYSPEPKWKLCIESNNDVSYIPSGFNTPMQLSTPGFLDIQENLALSPTFEASDTPTCLSDTPSSEVSNRLNQNTEEQQLISLLGLHMPVEHDLSPGSRNQLQQYMSIRLLLLRLASTRTAQENEMLEILKNSFRAYSKDSRRDGKELARLLVKDWECLQTTYSFQPSLAPLPPPTMSKSLSPVAHKFSAPVERHLSSEPFQRLVSSSSLLHVPLASPASSFAVNGSSQCSISGPLQAQFQHIAQKQQLPLDNRPPPALTEPMLNHTHYFPRVPHLDLEQFPNINTIDSSNALHSCSSAFQPQSVLSDSMQETSMNHVSPTPGTE